MLAVGTDCKCEYWTFAVKWDHAWVSGFSWSNSVSYWPIRGLSWMRLCWSRGITFFIYLTVAKPELLLPNWLFFVQCLTLNEHLRHVLTDFVILDDTLMIVVSEYSYWTESRRGYSWTERCCDEPNLPNCRPGTGMKIYTSMSRRNVIRTLDTF